MEKNKIMAENNKLEIHCKFLQQLILKDYNELIKNRPEGVEILKWRLWYWRAVFFGGEMEDKEIRDCSYCWDNTEGNSLKDLLGEENKMIEQLNKKCKTPCPAHCKEN